MPIKSKSHVLEQHFNNKDARLALRFLCANEETPLKIKKIIDCFAQTDDGKKLLSFLIKTGYKIKFTNLPSGTVGVHQGDKKHILLNKNKNFDLLVSTLAHEARHAQQLTNPKNIALGVLLSPETNVCLINALEADADAFATHLAWQLKEKGYPKIWEERKKLRPEVTKAYCDSIKRNQNPNKALSKAFDAWYSNQKVFNGYSSYYVDFAENMAKNSHQFFNSPDAFNTTIPTKDILINVCGCGGKSYFEGNPNNPKYQYMAEKLLKRLEKIIDTRTKETGIAPPYGLEILWQNLKKTTNKANTALLSLNYQTQYIRR